MNEKLIEDLRHVYSQMTPSGLERMDSDGAAFVIQRAIEALSPREQPEPVAWQVRIYGLDGVPGPWEPSVGPETSPLRPSRTVEFRALYAQPSEQTGGGGVVGEIVAERQRQIDAEGWSVAHDDKHPIGQLARAAGCYALSAGRDGSDDGFFDCVVDAAIHHSWPWDRSWWKPKDRRSDLIRAGALIVAEIERLDRAALSTPEVVK